MKTSAMINIAVPELPVIYQRATQAVQNRSEKAPFELPSEIKEKAKAKNVIKAIIIDNIKRPINK